MVGQVLGAVDALPDIYTELTISFFLLRRLLGVKTEGDKRGAKVCIYSNKNKTSYQLDRSIFYLNLFFFTLLISDFTIFNVSIYNFPLDN